MSERILLSMRQYAKHRGVSPEAVSKAVKAGRITTVVVDEKGTRKIDPHVADVEWKRNSDETKFRSSGAANRESETGETGAAQPPPDRVGEAMRGSRAVRESYAAKLAKLEFEEKSNTLCRVEDTEREAFKLARAIRDSVLNLPDRLAPQLAAETNVFKVHQMLSEELRKCLESLRTSHLESDLGNDPTTLQEVKE